MNSKVQLKWLLLFSVLLCFASAQILEQPFITYADHPDNLTFSVVSSYSDTWSNQTIDGFGPVLPTLYLVDPYNKIETKYLPTSNLTYTSKFTNSTYNKTAYFFTVPIAKGKDYKWTIRASNQVGPFELNLRDSFDTSFIVTGDLDLSPVAFPTWRMLSKTDWNNYDLFIHAGDLAYNIDFEEGKRGDVFFQSLSNTINKVPFTPIAGNHENFDQADLFNYRFKLPHYNSTFKNNVYHFQKNNVFFVFVNYDLFLKINKKQAGKDKEKEVFKYLEQIFKDNKDSETIRWRVVITHRPIVCGWLEKNDCSINQLALKPFEELYRKYKVDALLLAHEHIYERLRFMKNFEPLKSLKKDIDGSMTVFTDPSEPLTVINGLSGNSETWVKDYEYSNVNEKTFAGVQTYLEVKANDESFTVRALSSETREVLDVAKIVKTSSFVTPGKGWLNRIPSWVYPIFFVLMIGLAYAIIKMLSNWTHKKNEEKIASLKSSVLESSGEGVSLNEKNNASLV